MAHIIGGLRRDSSAGERQVLDLLKALPDDYYVWPEARIGLHRPDFIVLHPALGVLVLEVKDWAWIVSANPMTFTIQKRNGETFNQTNPFEHNRQVAIDLSDKLETRPDLIHSNGPHRGNLILPWHYAVTFTRLTRMDLFPYRELLETGAMLCADDLLHAAAFEAGLKNLSWRFRVDQALSPHQIDLVRGTVFPEIQIPSRVQGRDSGKTLDLEQEKIVRERLDERVSDYDPIPDDDGDTYNDDELSPQGEAVAQNFAVRLVRGVAGSGKTLVLGARARLLAQENPDWRIAIVTYNKSLALALKRQFRDVKVYTFDKLCYKWLQASNLWQSPIEDYEQPDWVNHILHDLPQVAERFEADFLQDEFNWIKDMGILNQQTYLDVPRTGRGTRLLPTERELVYQAFNAYQLRLEQERLLTWQDVAGLVLRALDAGLIPANQFDAVLVDEAQDFAPIWFEVLKRMLNPDTGVIFLAADATQRIYRKFTWKSLGLNIVGRTRILRQAYRNTYEIMQAAYELIRHNEQLQQELKDEDEPLLSPDLDPRQMRHDAYPVVRGCSNAYAERQYIVREIQNLLDNGYRPSDIAVLGLRSLNSYQADLENAGLPVIGLKDDNIAAKDAISVGTLHSAKGLEFRVVFVSQLQTLFASSGRLNSDPETFFVKRTRLLYVGMTRARDKLCMTYYGNLPRQLIGLKAFLDEAGELEDSPTA
ncbi:MAG: UvrD-helicase domain-containing protein [Anaerolineae bacterium]|nr:UvrD-helicase domain-containing protein [Anaerolineae bacterium]